jgi:hypothetical protein
MAGDGSARARWRKSKRSGETGCVECAAQSDLISVRDSKDPDGQTLGFDHETWLAFIEDAKKGSFDRP